MKSEQTKFETEKAMYVAGAVAAILVVAGSLLDISVSITLGGDLNALPKTAIERFAQIGMYPLLGMYNLDLLNLLTVLIMVPCTLALCLAHRKNYPSASTLVLVTAVIGTAIFLSGNPALPMLELSHKFATATPEQKTLLAAAGEAILARGEHGSAGIFLAFVIPTLSNIILSVLMLKGKIFGKLCGLSGLIGNSCLFVYLCLVTFVPQTRSAVTVFAAPGGIMAMIWLVLSAKGLLGIQKYHE